MNKQDSGTRYQDSREALHIYLADARHHLGKADFAKIDLVKSGWGDGNFI